MVRLQRKERKGDRSRRRIATPREQVLPTFTDGMVTVDVASEASAFLLERRGFIRIPTAPVAAPAVAAVKPVPTDSAPVLADMGMDALKALAKQHRVKGRSKMTREALIAALS